MFFGYRSLMLSVTNQWPHVSCFSAIDFSRSQSQIRYDDIRMQVVVSAYVLVQHCTLDPTITSTLFWSWETGGIKKRQHWYRWSISWLILSLVEAIVDVFHFCCRKAPALLWRKILIEDYRCRDNIAMKTIPRAFPIVYYSQKFKFSTLLPMM